jgi:hypothetical protein
MNLLLLETVEKADQDQWGNQVANSWGPPDGDRVAGHDADVF